MLEDTTSGNGEVLMDYLPKLIRLAEANMSSGLKKRVAAEEVAASVLGSVIRMKTEGKLQISIDDSSEFSALLTTIALRKIRKKARYHRQKKRDYRREMHITEDGPTLAEIIAQAGDPTDEDGIHLLKIFQQLEEQLTEDERIVMEGKRTGLSAEEIGSKIDHGRGRSTKTVGRIWKRILEHARRLVDEIDV